MSELLQLPIFASLPSDELSYLASSLRSIEVPKGSVIFREGEQGSSFYIIEAGEIEVVKDLGTPDEKVLSYMGPGDYVGEMSLLSLDGLRNASVCATEDSRLWEMTHEDFEALLRRHPSSAYALLRNLSQRLSTTQNEIIDDLRTKNTELVEAYEALKAAQEQIIEKERLERELQVAHKIQMSLLPSSLPELTGFELGALLEPARQVGGDLYNFIPLNEHRLGVLIGDVTDKGVPAAIFMAQVQALVRAEARRYDSPGEVLQAVNGLLGEKNDQGFFVTVLYGVLDTSTSTFKYARAGHELPIVCSATGDAEFASFNAGQPLGIFDDPILDDNEYTFTPGSAMVLYTDGVTDQPDQSEAPFREENLLQSVCGVYAIPAQELCDHLMQTIIEFRGGKAMYDDVTLVVIKKNL